MNIRKIIHIDMDAFFASIEQRDHPELKGKPVIVGGDPKKRGVVATCSYEARSFGVHSAMPSSQAVKLCPRGSFVRPRMQVYQAVSQKIREIFHQYTNLVEPLSLDEAYLDVTVNKKGEPSATRLAQRIKQHIFEETGLTASAGVSFNKFLAKVASDWKKPDGLTVIPPEKAVEFIENLPIRKFYGIGEVTEKKMLQLDIKTGADLRKVDREFLSTHFGKMGNFFYQMANCQDNRPVNPSRVRKSLGKEETFPEDIRDKEEVISVIHDLSSGVSSMLQSRHLMGRTVTVKVRYDDFTTVTRRRTLQNGFNDSETISAEAIKLLEKTEAGKRLVRLLGVSVSSLQSNNEKR
ncbi:MAG: DNA polymerase IV [Chlamydiae bacterium]|nr:DNA polymerase IV [Chlamydiota bacterium]